MQDRTAEFRATLQSLRLQRGPVPSATPIPRAQQSQLFVTARRIAESIQDTNSKLERLALLANRRGLYGDRPVEVQELTAVIKEDMNHLARAVQKVQEHIKTQQGRSSDAMKRHHNSIATSLQKALSRTTQRFKGILETRTENLKEARQRRGQYTGQGIGADPAFPASRKALMPTLMATPHLENSNSHAAPGAEHVAVDLFQTQDMILYEEQQDSYVSERAEAMQSIERTIGELGQIFQQMAEMIQMQGEKVERIDQNIEEVSINVEAAHSELLTYYQSISSNRALMFKILGVLLVFFILFVVVLA